jgi:uncharacterized protein YuzE
MQISYFPETDTLYLEISAQASAESSEVSPGVVLDYDAEGNIVGVEVEEVGRRLALEGLAFSTPATPPHRPTA